MLGGATLALASVLLLMILIPVFIPLFLAWCVVEVVYWLLRTRPTALQLNAQPPEGHWPPTADKDGGLAAFRRFIKVSMARKTLAVQQQGHTAAPCSPDLPGPDPSSLIQ
jgi:hypothetical protein